jgi:hypothetical protein
MRHFFLGLARTHQAGPLIVGGGDVNAFRPKLADQEVVPRRLEEPARQPEEVVWTNPIQRLRGGKLRRRHRLRNGGRRILPASCVPLIN